MSSKRRRERIEERRREAANQQRTLVIVGGAIVVLVIAAIIISTVASRGTTAPGSTGSTGSSGGSGVCALFPAYTGAETQPPALVIDTTASYTAQIVTDKGAIDVNLFASDAPQTVNNFMFLACNHFYDNLTFHRVIPGFMAQGGDPQGDGSGGPPYTIPDEFSQSTRTFDKAGLLSMAHTSAPNSAGSQFFITYAPTPHLDGAFTIFGEVANGMDAALAISPRDPENPETAGLAQTRITTITVQQVGQ